MRNPTTTHFFLPVHQQQQIAEKKEAQVFTEALKRLDFT